MGWPFELTRQLTPTQDASTQRRSCPLGQVIPASTSVVLSRPCTLFFPTTAGVNLVVALEGDPATFLTLGLGPFLQSSTLPLRIVEFDVTNGCAGIALFTE